MKSKIDEIEPVNDEINTAEWEYTISIKPVYTVSTPINKRENAAKWKICVKVTVSHQSNPAERSGEGFAEINKSFSSKILKKDTLEKALETAEENADRFLPNHSEFPHKELMRRVEYFRERNQNLNI